MHIKTHQQLQALEDEVAMNLPVTTRLRLDGIPDLEGPFEVKAFVMKQLKGFHAGLCAQHFHAPTKPPSGQFGSACAYCGWGHGGGSGGTTVKANAAEFGVQV